MENFILKFPPNTEFTDDELFKFCSANSELHIERDSKGQLIIMSPSGGPTGNIHFKIYHVFTNWVAYHENLGYGFDASVGFRLPDHSVLAPDAAFIRKDRWESLTIEEQEKFPPITPDFVIEVRSKSDSLKQLKSKMEDWIKNSCKLAWLIDPIEQKAYIYHPGKNVEIMESFDQSIKAQDVVEGFTIDLSILK